MFVYNTDNKDNFKIKSDLDFWCLMPLSTIFHNEIRNVQPLMYFILCL